MIREMRRKRQQLSTEESLAIVNKMTSGVLALTGDDGYPYAVPISYVYHSGKIYFHSATSGHKIDALLKSDQVSFCVIGQDNVVPKEYTTYFRSVIIFGRAHIVENNDEKLKAIRILAEKYSPNENGLAKEIEKSFKHLHVIELIIEHMTGKESIELIKEKK